MPGPVRTVRSSYRSLLPAVALLLFSLLSAADLVAQAQATTGIIRGQNGQVLPCLLNLLVDLGHQDDVLTDLHVVVVNAELGF